MTNEELAGLVTILFGIVIFFVKAKMAAIDGHINDKNLHQTADERKALSALLEQEFKTHEKFDIYRFGQIDETAKRIEGKVDAQDEKLDKILTVVNKWSGLK